MLEKKKGYAMHPWAIKIYSILIDAFSIKNNFIGIAINKV